MIKLLYSDYQHYCFLPSLGKWTAVHAILKEKFLVMSCDAHSHGVLLRQDSCDNKWYLKRVYVKLKKHWLGVCIVSCAALPWSPVFPDLYFIKKGIDIQRKSFLKIVVSQHQCTSMLFPLITVKFPMMHILANIY